MIPLLGLDCFACLREDRRNVDVNSLTLTYNLRTTRDVPFLGITCVSLYYRRSACGEEPVMLFL